VCVCLSLSLSLWNSFDVEMLRCWDVEMLRCWDAEMLRCFIMMLIDVLLSWWCDDVIIDDARLWPVCLWCVDLSRTCEFICRYTYKCTDYAYGCTRTQFTCTTELIARTRTLRKSFLLFSWLRFYGVQRLKGIRNVMINNPEQDTGPGAVKVGFIK
jgi:hypothetical protein